MAKRLDSIKRDKVNWHNDDAGINVDEDLDEEEIGMRLTKLQPDERGPRRDRGQDRDRRGKSQVRPRRERDDQDFDADEQEQAPKRAQKKQEKFNGGKVEDFPEF